MRLKSFFMELVIFFLWLISFLPMWVIVFLSGIIEQICWRLICFGLLRGLKTKYHVVTVNLKLCFPKKTEGEINALVHANFKETIIALLHYGLVFKAGKPRLEKLVKYENIAAIKEHYLKRPVIFLAPHFWGLDIGANRFSINFTSYSMMYDDSDSILRAKLKTARMRFMVDQGGEVFSRQDGISKIVKKLRRTKFAFYYLPDIDLGEANSLYVPFFAHASCATLSSLAKITQLTRAVIVPMVTFRESGRYVVKFYDAWENYPSLDESADVLRMNQFIEKMILEHPEQYMWSLKRFGTQPNLAYGSLYSTS